MPYTEADIREIISRGESGSVEFKSDDIHPGALAREIVAFANSQGGTIFIGIGDNGSIEGIANTTITEEWVANICRNNITPPLGVFFNDCTLQQNRIIYIEVPKGKDKPYQTQDGKYYIRIGSTNRIASNAELLRLFQATGYFHYDATPIEKTGIQDLNLAKIDGYFNRYEFDFLNTDESERSSILMNSDILAENGQTTLAGMLLFGINPNRALSHAAISFAHFSQNEITDELIDKQTIGGTLDYQVDASIAVIKNNLRAPSNIIGARREDAGPAYPDKVFRELIVNACVHRNYAIHGSQIRIFMFPDRIEFRSPGKLPNTVTIEKLRVGVSYSINPVIVKFMENLRYVDRLGRGLPMVCREAARINKRVIFKELGDEFVVVLEL